MAILAMIAHGQDARATSICVTTVGSDSGVTTSLELL
jgi:hypothetical protein